MFGRKPTDPLAEARSTIERLTKEAAEADRAAAAAMANYNSVLQKYVAEGLKGAEPSLAAQTETAGRAELMKHMLVVASESLARLTSGVADATRDAAIRASGSQVAQLVAAVESKLIDFETAIHTAREIESELFALLFDQNTGMKQNFADPVAKKDATWLRYTLVKRLIAIAEKSECRVDARFETDGGWHCGELETRFYRKPIPAAQS